MSMLFNLINIEFKVKSEVILKKKSLKIHSGKHLLIYGPSGSGKTTLVNIMTGLIKPSKGQIYYKNNDYEKLNIDQIDNLRLLNFGLIFQKLHLIGHLNVQQNISIAQSTPNFDRINELMKSLDIFDKRNQKAGDLSVGEAQRVAIARGVVNNPSIIFADEPTSALDDVNAQRVINLIFSQANQTKATLIVSTHDQRIKGLFSNSLEVN